MNIKMTMNIIIAHIITKIVVPPKAATSNAFPAVLFSLKGVAVGFGWPQCGHFLALVLISLPQVLHGLRAILTLPL